MMASLIKFWTREHCLGALLAILVVQLFTLVPAVGGGLLLRVVADLCLSVFLLAGIFTMGQGKFFIILFSILVAIGAIVHLARQCFGVEGLAGCDFLFETLGLATVLFLTLRMVYQDGPITRPRILGAIAAYLMLAGLFGKVYSLINYFIPGAFNASQALARISAAGTEDFLYFSVVALTTMGFGDITPIAPIARSFVMVEGFIGQLYPAVFIARLVSLSITAREKQ